MSVDPRRERRVFYHHFACDEAQQSTARDNKDRKTLDQFQDELRSNDDEWNAHDQAEHNQQHAAFRRAGNADNVVEAHHQIGDDDRAYRDHQPVGGLHIMTITVFVGDELDPNPDQQHAPDQIEVGKFQQADGEERQDDPQYNGARSAPEDAPTPLALRQVAARKRDDHRVVAGQQDVDDDDLKRCDPKLRRCEFHAALSGFLSDSTYCASGHHHLRAR